MQQSQLLQVKKEFDLKTRKPCGKAIRSAEEKLSKYNTDLDNDFDAFYFITRLLASWKTYKAKGDLE